ncbi:hypothetical protein Pmani_021010 [Petrolisthes manimaculis]|uniref:Uncharacterized protein n=1 Tax=Petrolisthes manimaculis TaxID=1843537 RepID=A0AAE1PEL5_9EUCA|nr:hypothetical protein Pmani_021010 [Petrolisthes manimaculis]
MKGERRDEQKRRLFERDGWKGEEGEGHLTSTSIPLLS